MNSHSSFFEGLHSTLLHFCTLPETETLLTVDFSQIWGRQVVQLPIVRAIHLWDRISQEDQTDAVRKEAWEAEGSKRSAGTLRGLQHGWALLQPGHTQFTSSRQRRCHGRLQGEDSALSNLLHSQSLSGPAPALGDTTHSPL